MSNSCGCSSKCINGICECFGDMSEVMEMKSRFGSISEAVSGEVYLKRVIVVE